MTPLSIEAIGAFTSVGPDVPTTMGSLLAQVQLFEDMLVVTEEGLTLTGAPTPLPSRIDGAERLATLASLALSTCEPAIEAAPPTPLVLCTSDEKSLGASPRALLESIAARAPVAIDTKQSRVVSRGRISVVTALAHVAEILMTPRVARCYLLGADSLVTRARLAAAIAHGGAASDPENPGGYVPGEATAALRIGRGAEVASPLATILAVADEAGAAGEAEMVGAGLSRAAASALTTTKQDIGSITTICHDITTPVGFEEMTMAMARPPLSALAGAKVLSPALSVGEIGAAFGPLALAMLAHFLHQGVIEGRAAALFTSESTSRGFAVLEPRQGGRKGDRRG